MSEAYRKHTRTCSEDRHLIVGDDAVAPKRGEVVMSMLTLQVPTAACEILFQATIGDKFAEHFLTRKKCSTGTDCAVVVWGATVDPKTLRIVPCDGRGLLAQLQLWERIFQWYKTATSRRTEPEVTDLRLSGDDIKHLDSTCKLYFLMNCSPNHASIAAMKRKCERELKATTETLNQLDAIKQTLRRRLEMYRRLGKECNLRDSQQRSIEAEDLQEEAAFLAKQDHLQAMITLLDKHRHATVRLYTDGTPLLANAVGKWPLRLLVGITESELLEAGSELLHDYTRSWHTMGAFSQCGCDSCDEHLLTTGQFGIAWDK